MGYDNTNRGVLFPNDRKETDKHPDFKGSINVEGREYWLSGWKKQGKKGPLVSLSVQPKEAAQQERRQPPKSDPFALDDAPPASSPDDYGADW